MNSEINIPSVLLQNQAQNENQNTSLNTVRLTPNSFSNNTVVFVLPKLGSVLDYNSSLVWSVSWDGYDAAKLTNNQRVCLKNFSGCLNSLRRARMYVGGRLLFQNPDVAQVVHIDKISTNPDHLEEVEDVKLGGQHGYYVFEGTAPQTGVAKLASDVSTATPTFNRVTRALGSYSTTGTDNAAWEGTILLSDLFQALKGGLQLPIKFLKEEVRIEIDFETDFNEVALNIKATDALANTNISVKNPLMYLDYLTYEPVVEAGIMEAMASGISIPYREISQIVKVIPGYTDANKQTDVFLGFQGKLLMKIYFSLRTANVVNATRTAMDRGNGRCRSERGKNMKWNCLVNDLFIFDQPVDTASQQYNYLSMAKQYPIYVFPNSFDYNKRWNQAVSANDFNADSVDIGGTPSDVAVITKPQVRDMVAGTQAYFGIDLSKYGPDGGINPQNAGFRVGSTPIVLQLTYDGAAATTPDGSAHTVECFVESVKVLQIRNGMVDTMDA